MNSSSPDRWSENRTIRLASLALLIVFLLQPQTVAGQLDWLNKGREVLEAVTTPGDQQPDTTLTRAEIVEGLKEALRVGSSRVVEQLGTVDGYYEDPQVHIPLPGNLEKVRSALKTVGMSSMMDDLEIQLNRAAEQAAGKAKPLFMDAISTMTIEDAMQIYRGPDDAATRYFENRMADPLAEEMRPIVAESLQEVGAMQTYDAAVGRYKSLPFVPDIQTDLTGYVIERGMAGIFLYLGKEEAAIRSDPVQRTTDILKKVFGSK